MNRPLGRQIIGAVVFISNSVCPRMGFLIEEKQFKTEKVNCERKLQQSHGNWEHGEICNNCRGKQTEDTAEGSFRRLCWEGYLVRFEEPLKSSKFILLDWVKLAENCTYFYYRNHEALVIFWTPNQMPR